MAESMVWFATIFAILSVAASVEDKCAACIAVAEELEFALSSEKPRNHLDMRHRLDSKGQREGKVIDYRVSELRVVELLDGLCDKMQDYTLEKIDSNGQKWVRVDWDNLTTNKQEARTYSKDISSYCGRLLEETEDGLAELIKKGSVKTGDVSKVLCQNLSTHCGQMRLLLQNRQWKTMGKKMRPQGWVQCGRKFVKGYSRRTALITELLKKGHGWNWTEECQGSFDDLKDTMMIDPEGQAGSLTNGSTFDFEYCYHNDAGAHQGELSQRSSCAKLNEAYRRREGTIVLDGRWIADDPWYRLFVP
ncbi:uncharacterized protein LOC131162886 [Malania oleifera]|uniref:uncharacterized protein LOC131162886 n=1 Tax=Malania oleifera TaxID=397392 RepID=UPI0025AE95CB|nr:uncharacterized protein LOC131162886 [Malania oleifera]